MIRAMIRAMPRAMPPRLAAAILLSLSIGTAPLLADSSATPPRLPGKASIEQKLDTQIPLDLMFRDESGKVVRLRELFRGKPVLLNFMYYRCPMLCSMVMDGLSGSLTELKLNIGTDFDVVTVSIDPRDTPQQATLKKEQYVKRYGRFGAATGWHFLTAHDTSIHRLTRSVGFEYAYDPAADQFAHATAVIVLTPAGRVSRYFYGFEYKARDLRLGLVEASANRIGTTTDQLLLLCYHYDPATGKYSRSAMTLMRAGGVATVFSLAGLILFMVRGERKKLGGSSGEGGQQPLPDEPANDRRNDRNDQGTSSS